MADGPEWFAPKRYGYGSGMPISWQGWAVTFGFIAVTVAVGVVFKQKPLAAVAILIPAVVLLLVVAAKTTRGGWKWRWGDSD